MEHQILPETERKWAVAADWHSHRGSGALDERLFYNLLCFRVEREVIRGNRRWFHHGMSFSSIGATNSPSHRNDYTAWPKAAIGVFRQSVAVLPETLRDTDLRGRWIKTESAFSGILPWPRC
jgi:hypothetical protein